MSQKNPLLENFLIAPWLRQERMRSHLCRGRLHFPRVHCWHLQGSLRRGLLCLCAHIIGSYEFVARSPSPSIRLSPPLWASRLVLDLCTLRPIVNIFKVFVVSFTTSGYLLASGPHNDLSGVKNFLEIFKRPKKPAPTGLIFTKTPAAGLPLPIP